MDDRKKLLLEGPIGRALVRLALPILFGNMLQAGYALTDAFWVGRLGAAAVAAVSVSFPITMLVITLGSGLAIAGATLAAQYVGAGRQDMVDHIAGQTMVMVAITSAILGGLGFALAPFILVQLDVAPDVYAGALAFMRMSFVGIIFVFLFAMFQALMRSIGRPKVPVLIVAGTVVLNFLLDPLFIFGYGPIPALGVMGAAAATLATQALAAAIGLAIFWRGKHGINLTWQTLRPDPVYLKRTFLLGVPSSIEVSMRAVGPMLMSFLATGFGTVTMAAYGVGTNVLQVVTMGAMSLSMAVSTLVGQNMGAGAVERAGRVARLGALAAFVVLTLAGLAATLFAEECARFFVPGDPTVIAGAAQFLRTMGWAWGLLGVQTCIGSAFRATGMMKVAMAIAVVSQLLVQFPLAYALAKGAGLGAQGLWLAFPLTNAAVSLLAVALFAQGRWKTARLLTAQHERAPQPARTALSS